MCPEARQADADTSAHSEMTGTSFEVKLQFTSNALRDARTGTGAALHQVSPLLQQLQFGMAKKWELGALYIGLLCCSCVFLILIVSLFRTTNTVSLPALILPPICLFIRTSGLL
jgi:hypothetical protein